MVTPFEEAVERGRAKAEADMIVAIRAARRRAAALTPADEWVVSGFEGRPHYVIPNGPSTRGMLEHIEKAYAATHGGQRLASDD